MNDGSTTETNVREKKVYEEGFERKKTQTSREKNGKSGETSRIGGECGTGEKAARRYVSRLFDTSKCQSEVS